MRCPQCNSDNQAKDGFTPAGTQRHRCLECKIRYTKVLSETQKTRVIKTKRAIELRRCGLSLRQIAKKLNINHQTVRNMTNGGIGSFVYLAKRGDDYKIGMTEQVMARMGNLSPIDLVAVIKTDNARFLEKSLHEKFNSKRITGEWFRLTDDDVRYISDRFERGVERRSGLW